MSAIDVYMEDCFTIPVNLAGLPGLSHPIGFNHQRRPYGMQLVGQYHGELDILRAAHQFHQVSDYHLQVADAYA